MKRELRLKKAKNSLKNKPKKYLKAYFELVMRLLGKSGQLSPLALTKLVKSVEWKVGRRKL
jgi:hypothetical protein